MEGLKIYSQSEVTALTNIKEGETKLGQKVQTISSLEEIDRCEAQFVILGIPDAYGLSAQQGTAGNASAWETALKTLVNVQSNLFLSGNEIILLGHLEFSVLQSDDLEALSKKVEEIDALVYSVLEKIFNAGKVPIVISSGNNNAYPIIKALSFVRKKPVDIINIDTYAALSISVGRNSENAFTRALREGLIKNYGIFGLHENYMNEALLTQILDNPLIHCIYFDELIKTKDRTTIWPDFNKRFDYQMGLELNLNAIENSMSSASSPSGFTLNDMRRLVLNTKKKLSYLHLCEGAVQRSDAQNDQASAKTIIYLITDCIKAQINV